MNCFAVCAGLRIISCYVYSSEIAKSSSSTLRGKQNFAQNRGEMEVIETSIVIQASADRVWMILTDLDNYMKWNPFIVFARGNLVTGQRLQLRRATDMTNIPRYGMVIAIDADDRRLSWTTCGIISRFLKTNYSFAIERIDTETVRFSQRETLSGLIPAILRRGRLNNRQSYMEAMNKALKRVAENKKHLLPSSRTTGA